MHKKNSYKSFLKEGKPHPQNKQVAMRDHELVRKETAPRMH